MTHHSRNGFLTVEGYALHAQRERKRCGLDFMGARRYLDNKGSVSALIEVEDDFDYDPEHVELNNAQLLQLEMFHG